MMIEKSDEKTMCLETVKAIDLRQRKTRYRFWICTSVIIVFGVYFSLLYSSFVFVKEINSKVGYDVFKDPSLAESIVLIVIPMFILVLLFILMIDIDKYLRCVYFPKEEEETKK